MESESTTSPELSARSSTSPGPSRRSSSLHYSSSPRVAQHVQAYAENDGVRRPVSPAGELDRFALPASAGDLYLQSKMKYHRALAQSATQTSQDGDPREIRHTVSDILVDLIHPPAHVLPPSFFIRPPWQSNEGTQGSVSFIFTVCTTMMGSTILCLPWGFARCGVITSMIVIYCLGGASLYTGVLIMHWGSQSSQPVDDFSDLCDMYLGPRAKNLANLTSILILFGAASVYHVFIASNLQAVIRTLAPMAGVDAGFLCCGSGDNQYALVSSVVSLSLLPLLFTRDIKRLATMGSWGVLSLFYTVAFLIATSAFSIHDASKRSAPYQEVKLVGGMHDVGVLVGMMGCSIFCHNVILQISSSHVCARTDPFIVKRDLGIAFFLTIIIYTGVGALPAIAFYLGRDLLPQYEGFRGGLPENILLIFPDSSVGALIARLLLSMQCAVVFSILMSVMRQQIFTGFLNVAHLGWKSITVFNLSVASAMALITAVYPHPGEVVGYLGAYTAVAYLFGFPLAVHLSALKHTGQGSGLVFAGHVALGLAGTGAVLLQFCT